MCEPNYFFNFSGGIFLYINYKVNEKCFFTILHIDTLFFLNI